MSSPKSHYEGNWYHLLNVGQRRVAEANEPCITIAYTKKIELSQRQRS